MYSSSNTFETFTKLLTKTRKEKKREFIYHLVLTRRKKNKQNKSP